MFQQKPMIHFMDDKIIISLSLYHLNDFLLGGQNCCQ